MEAVKAYLKEHNKKLAVICSLDSNQNEYDHQFYLCDEGEEDNTAWSLEMRKMEDVCLYQTDIDEAVKLGFTGIEDCYNY